MFAFSTEKMASIDNPTAGVGGESETQNQAVVVPTPVSGVQNQTVGVQPPVTTGLAPNVAVSHAERPDKFKGGNFKIWKQKMIFFLTTLNLAKVLKEVAPVLAEDETDATVVAAEQSWRYQDFLCKHYILQSLDDTLYNVYCSKESAKAL